MKQVETDVIIVAAGTAGMAAAVTAAENGARVVVFEKSATTGGSGNMARGPFAVDSKLQRMRKIALTREEAFKIFMDYTHWRVDARLVSEFINKSASTLDWLEKMGVEFVDVQCHNYGFYFTAHLIKGPLEPRDIPGTGVVMMKILTNKAQELGVKFYFRTPVKKIIKEGGKITGVLAEDESGEQIQAKGKAVIIATGGFGDNPEMIKKYIGLENTRGRVPGVTGDGIRMAWEAGAGRSEMIFHGGTGGASNLMKYLHLTSAFGQPNLVVNLLGERFMNEEIRQTTPFGGNAISVQKDKTAFVIFDQDTKKYYMEEGLDFPPGMLYADPIFTLDDFDTELEQALNQENDSLFVVDSIEELAVKIGIEETKLMKTTEEYNRACDTGRDEIFHKNPKFLRPVRNPKFYACKLAGVSGFGTLGGIKVNHNLEVLTKEFDVIPGLYAAGVDANSLNGDTYIFILPGNTLGFALNSGRMAAENAVRYIKSVT